MINKINSIKKLGYRNTLVIIGRKIVFAARDLKVIYSGYLNRDIVLYLGYVGHMNLGDEILFDAHKEVFSNLDIRHINYYFSLRLANKIRKPFFRNAILGGGTLIDHSENWIKPIEYLQSAGTIFSSLGTGVEDLKYWPTHVKKTDHLKRWKKALDQFYFLGIRGPESYRLLSTDFKVKEATVIGDTALSMIHSSIITEKYTQNSPHSKTIGFSFGNTPGQKIWGDKDKYRQNVINVVKNLIAKDYTVVFLPIWDLDIMSNREIVGEINDPRCKIIEAHTSYADYIRELKKVDFFIGQKLHATIMALMCGIPSIIIEYHPKCKDFMSSIGMEKYVIKTSDFDNKSFSLLFESLHKNKNKIMSNASKKMQNYYVAQQKEADKITEHIRK